MSVTINKTYTIKFTNKADKTKVIGYLMHSNFSFKGTDIDTIIVGSDAYEALKRQNICLD